jgi:hypothetical protein
LHNCSKQDGWQKIVTALLGLPDTHDEWEAEQARKLAEARGSS